VIMMLDMLPPRMHGGTTALTLPRKCKPFRAFKISPGIEKSISTFQLERGT